MNYETAEVQQSEEVTNKELIITGLAAVQGKLNGPDMARIALKVGRSSFTVKKYIDGDVPDEELGLKILRYANGIIAINNNSEYQKEQLNY